MLFCFAHLFARCNDAGVVTRFLPAFFCVVVDMNDRGKADTPNNNTSKKDSSCQAEVEARECHCDSHLSGSFYCFITMVFGIFRGCGSSQQAVVTVSDKLDRTESDATESSSAPCRSKGSLLESLAANSQWQAVIRLVENSHASDWDSANDVDAAVTTTAPARQLTTPVHVAVAHGAPVHVVDALLVISKTRFGIHVPEEARDERGRTPLHVAVTAGCDEDVVYRLLAGDNLIMPAVARDKHGQTPLHAACVASVSTKTKSRKVVKADLRNKQRVIQVLLDHYPEGATLLDVQNKSPVDHAVETKLPQATLDRLQDAANVHTPKIMADMSVVSDADLLSVASSDVPLMVTSPAGSRTAGNGMLSSSMDSLNDNGNNQHNRTRDLYADHWDDLSGDDDSDNVSSLGDDVVPE